MSLTVPVTSPTAESELLEIPEQFFIDAETKNEIDQFLYFEASLLDERRYLDWYRLFAEDLFYVMPNRSNRLTHEAAKENTTSKQFNLFDETYASLGWRVKQVASKKHWAEDPPSRARHLVTNIRVTATDLEDQYNVHSNFLIYRNRLESEVDFWVGERQDVIRRIAPRAWKIARRTIILDQNVVLSKNFSIFF
jgi:3-phenylpropionate/cinnamic acid dioxygenase small subunit